jgi:hypothetical protein
VLQLLGDEAFRDGPREVITEIVAFAPEKDLGANRIQARTHTVEFNI